MLSPGVHVKGYTMRPYQVRAAHKIFCGTQARDYDTGDLVDGVFDGTNVHIDMGLGKTIIGLTAISDWFRFGIMSRPVLVVAPIKVCETVWRQEARDWSHTRHLRFEILRGNERDRAFALARCPTDQPRGVDVYLVNPEMLKWLHKYLREDWSFFGGLIIDDVALKDHRSLQFRKISNYGNQTAQKCPLTGKAIRDKFGATVKVPPHRFKRAAKLTGTPSTAGLHQIWAPNYLMDHGSRLHKHFDTFEGRYFHKGKQVATHVYDIEVNKEEAESRPDWQAREGAPQRIHEVIADMTIELNAEDYGVLPKTIGDASKGNLEDPQYSGFAPGNIHRVELPDDIRPKYDQLEREALLELERDVVMAQNGGAKSMMCWQIANGAVYYSDDFGQKAVQEMHNAKLDKMVELLDRMNTNVIIPYFFQHDFARITARLQKEGMDFASLKGRNTQRIIDRWNEGNIPILLLHPQSAGHGLNLQFGAHTLLWFTQIWSLERYLQTNARLARSGQLGIVNIHHIVASRTTDELMMINYRQNGSTQEQFRRNIREYQQLRGMVTV